MCVYMTVVTQFVQHSRLKDDCSINNFDGFFVVASANLMILHISNALVWLLLFAVIIAFRVIV